MTFFGRSSLDIGSRRLLWALGLAMLGLVAGAGLYLLVAQ